MFAVLVASITALSFHFIYNFTFGLRLPPKRWGDVWVFLPLGAENPSYVIVKELRTLRRGRN